MRIIIYGLAAISLSACTSTTQREEVRSDIKNLEQSREDLHAAERDGSTNDVREAREEVQKGEETLRSSQNELYRPGAEGIATVALQVGERDTGNLYSVPEEYRDQYRDTDVSYHRYDGLRMYRINRSDRIVTGVYQVRH